MPFHNFCTYLKWIFQFWSLAPDIVEGKAKVRLIWGKYANLHNKNLDLLFEHLKAKNKARGWKKRKYECERAYEVIFDVKCAKFCGAI